MKRGECLDKANSIVNGERQKNYGTPENNFQRIAELWTSYLQNREEEHLDYLSAKDVAIMMILMKVARLMNDPKHEDSWTDIAGYAACGCEITTDETVSESLVGLGSMV